MRPVVAGWPGKSVLALVVLMAVSGTAIFAGSGVPTPLLTLDESGILSTYTENHRINLDSAFFKSLGTNGRSCAYLPPAGGCLDCDSAEIFRPGFFLVEEETRFSGRWMGRIVLARMFLRWRSGGQAYSMLLKKGLIRVSLAVPTTADFSIQDIRDPYDCPETNSVTAALYRRPLPSTNLGFLATVMWDGRETVKGAPIADDLATQAIDATLGHAEAAQAPTTDQVADIVTFETDVIHRTSL